jgi:hypothetical protein
MVLAAQCFQGIGAFEVDRLKVSALKLSHPPACSVFQNFSHFSLLRHSLKGRGGYLVLELGTYLDFGIWNLDVLIFHTMPSALCTKWFIFLNGTTSEFL